MSIIYKWINTHVLKGCAEKCFTNKKFGSNKFNPTWSFHWWWEGPFGFNGPWFYVFEEHSQLSSLDSPTRAECISCPRRRVCAHLCRSTDMSAQKPQDAINGPLRTVPSTVKSRVALSLQIILNPSYLLHALKHTKQLRSNFICVYRERQGRCYCPVLHVRKEI